METFSYKTQKDVGTVTYRRFFVRCTLVVGCRENWLKNVFSRALLY